MTGLGSSCREMVITSLKKYNLPFSEAAVRLLCMIAAHESGGFKYLQQIRGPAVSIFQIEPDTLKDLVEYADRRKKNIPKCKPHNLVFNQELATAYARVFFLRFKEPIPDEDDIMGMARYAKRYWNTMLGKASVEDYYKAYSIHFS